MACPYRNNLEVCCVKALVVLLVVYFLVLVPLALFQDSHSFRFTSSDDLSKLIRKCRYNNKLILHASVGLTRRHAVLSVATIVPNY